MESQKCRERTAIRRPRQKVVYVATAKEWMLRATRNCKKPGRNSFLVPLEGASPDTLISDFQN